jgi:hypothetical protein
MSGPDRRHDLSAEETLKELHARFLGNIAVGLTHAEGSEAGLDKMSQQQRSQIRTKVDTIGGIPIATAIPPRKKRKKVAKER